MVKTILQIGILIMERMVDATTSFVAKISSQPYLDARILVVAPAGMAVKSTQTPVTRDGSFMSRQTTYKASGISTRRRIEYRSTSQSKIDFQSASAKIIPMTIMESAVLQFPIVPIVFVITAGGLYCVRIRIKPIKQAIIQGCVTTFFKVAFQSFDCVKIAIPDDHIIMRMGIRNMDAIASPIDPKTPSATGFPRNPALEQITPYCKAHTMSHFSFTI